MTTKIETAIGGAYEMPDGRSFWVDAVVAREITRRVVAALHDCNICGGLVDVSEAKKPTAHVGPGGNRHVAS